MWQTAHLTPRSYGFFLAALVGLAAVCRADDGVPCEPDQPVCSDGDLCNGVETCDPETRTCQPGAPLSCNDGDSCTIDSCDPSLGCLHLPIPGLCGQGFDRLFVRMIVTPLEDLRAQLAGARPRDLGGPGLAARLRRRVSAALALVRPVCCTDCSPATRISRTCVRRAYQVAAKACGRVRTFVALVQEGVARGTVDATIADRLLADVPAVCVSPPLPPPR
jgi:hypothetical protein